MNMKYFDQPYTNTQLLADVYENTTVEQPKNQKGTFLPLRQNCLSLASMQFRISL